MMEPSRGAITATQARALQHKTEAVRIFTYERLLTDAYQVIRSASEKGLGLTLYTVPSLMLGLPIFDKEAAARYITASLLHKGFRAYHLPSYHSVLVSWMHVPPSHPGVPPPNPPPPSSRTRRTNRKRGGALAKR